MGRAAKVLVLVVFALSLVLLASCTSVGAVLRANISGIPYWYYNPQMGIARDRVGMVGEGSASTERQAELLAYTDVINKLSERLGYELPQEAYRELSVLETITEFGLSVEDKFSNIQEGHYNCYLHVSIDASLLEKATSEENKRRDSLTQEVASLVLQGDEYVKSGQEIRAISNYIKAMTLSFDQDYIDSEYKYDELYPVVLELLDSISLSIVSSRPELATCVVSMTRRGKFASSSVSSAEVMATFNAEDTRGVIYNDYFVYVTNDNGEFTFNPINDAIARTGSVRFNLNLYDEVDDLEVVAGAEKVAELRSTLNSKSIVFEYSKTFVMGSIAIAAIEHDDHGYVTGVKNISDYMSGKYKAEGAKAAPFYAELDEVEDVLYEFTHSGRDEDYLLVVRMGTTEHISSKTGVEVASAEGIVVLYSRFFEDPLYESDIIHSTAFADTYEEAVQGAFRILADIAYTLVKAVYV